MLAEVRALRADINQFAGANIRSQLLVARLQLQEQRVFTVARQLVEAQNTLAAVQATITGERVRASQLEDAASRATGRTNGNSAIRDAEIQIEQQQQQERQLRAGENELLRAVDDAQIRWTDFNDRLDALERSLPSGVSR